MGGPEKVTEATSANLTPKEDAEGVELQPREQNFQSTEQPESNAPQHETPESDTRTEPSVDQGDCPLTSSSEEKQTTNPLLFHQGAAQDVTPQPSTSAQAGNTRSASVGGASQRPKNETPGAERQKPGGGVAKSALKGAVGISRVTPQIVVKKVLATLGGPLVVFIGILGYVFIFAAAFNQLENTDYFPTSVYWAVVTLLTIGYGDVTPKTDAMKGLTIMYILLGITLIVSGISVITSAVTESRLQIQAADRLNKHIERAAILTETPTGEDVPVRIKTEKDRTTFLPNLYKEAAVVLLKIVLVLVVVLAIGVLFFVFSEDMRFLDGFYFTVVTLSTVGYGDFPISKRGQRFLIFYIMFGVTIFTACLSLLIGQLNKVFELRRVKRWTSMGVTRELLFEADKDGSGSVDRQEFTLYYLEKLGRLNSADVTLIQDMFDRYDRDGSGKLDLTDLPT